MSVLGIIAEYNPFHNGHLRHLRESVSAVAPSATVVALSGPFTQRGELALLSPFARAECAIKEGADAVFALPVLWTVRDAEHYAFGAVSILASLGVTHLAFGAETSDLPLLQETANLLEDSPNILIDALHTALSEGKGYPAALAEAAGNCLPECGSVLNHPNNILAVCYLRAIRRIGLSLHPVLIHRRGGYYAERIAYDAPSASALREALRRGAWQPVLSAVPACSASAVRAAFLNGEIPNLARLDSVLLDSIRSLSPKKASSLPDCPEGLDTALLKSAALADSREELISLLTTRRYPAARISRLCAYALLNVSKDRLSSLSLPDSVLLLAIKKNRAMTRMWKSTSVQVLTASKWQDSADPEDLKAWRLWCLACGLPDSYPYTQKLLVFE